MNIGSRLLPILLAGFAGVLASPASGWALTEGSPCPLGAASGGSLVDVTAEARPGKVYRLSALVDSQGDLTHLRYEGSRIGTVCFSVEDLRRGSLIMKQESREIIRLRTRTGFDAREGGEAELEFLVNGVSGRYERFRMSVERQGHWRLFSDGQAFNRLHFTNRTGFLGMVIGVNPPVPSYR
jgi:hypothetical protein